MLYAILCYDSEEAVSAWSSEEDAEAMLRLGAVEATLASQGKLGPVARLMPTGSARTLRKRADALVVDGPFAETKEQLLGFFVVDCASTDEAVAAARALAGASLGKGAYEIRPMRVFRPGAVAAST